MTNLIGAFEGKLRGNSFRIPMGKVMKNGALNRYYEAAVAAAKRVGHRDPEGFAEGKLNEMMETVVAHLDRFVTVKGLKMRELSDLVGESLESLSDLFTGKNKKGAVEALKKSDERAAAIFKELGKDLETSLKEQVGDRVSIPERLGMLKKKSKRKWSLEEGDVVEGGKKVKRVVRAVKKLKEVEVELQEGPGGRLRFRVRKRGTKQWSEYYEEFDVLREAYSERPRSTEVMQAHHGCQSALMKEVFGGLYDAGEAPTIWMRDSTSGSPHRIASDLQEARLGPVKSASGPKNPLTYEKVRAMAESELRQAGGGRITDKQVNDYLAAVDDFVRSKVLAKKKLPVDQVRRMLGNVPGLTP
jgi:hypothetical protein